MAQPVCADITANTVKTAFADGAGHARAHISAADAEQIRGLISRDSWANSCYNALISDADALVNAAAAPFTMADSLRMDCTASGKIRTLAFAYHMTKDSKYFNAAWREIEAACDYPNWNHRNHFLDTAEMAKGVALGYDWCFNALTAQQKTKIETAIKSFAIEPALEVYNKTADFSGSYWAENTKNWNIVCNGGITVACCIMFENNPDYYAPVISNALNSFRYAMEVYAPDGGFDEGTGYWDYATGALVECMQALEGTFNTDFGLYDYEGVSETGAFTIYLEGNKKTFTYGDGYDQSFISPTSAYFAMRNGDSSLWSFLISELQKNI